jgi:hypothetical protein
MLRTFIGSAFVVALLGYVALNTPSATAQVGGKDKAQTGNEVSHEGKIVSVTKNKIVMKGEGATAKEHTHTVAATAKITCDGKVCVLSDLKPGQRVRVFTPRDNAEMAVRIEALDKNRAFENLPGGAGK